MNIHTMLTDIEREVRYTKDMIGRDKFAPAVMQAMASVPRERFVSEDLRDSAFDNGPLPIGHGQTISQPYIVALMTDLLDLRQDSIVLEVGTGSGYQTAVLSQLCKQVYSVEVIPELSELAEKRFHELGYDNIETLVGNGYHGWPEHAEYDAIIVTAAATHIPPALVQQLKPGGRMVIPIGLAYYPQQLMLLTKDAEGETRVDEVLGVAFVPLQQEAVSHATH